MSVTVTFEKKHFLMMGLIIAIPFLILAISNIIATTPAPTGQYHSASELWVNQDIEMNNFKLNNSGNISIMGSENGIIFPDGTVQTTAGITPPSASLGITNVFFVTSGYETTTIGIQDYCISQGYIKALQYEYDKNKYGAQTGCCSQGSNTFNIVKVVLSTENSQVYAGDTTQMVVSGGVHYNARFWFKVLCSM